MKLIARTPTNGFINKAIAWYTSPLNEKFNGKWKQNGYSHTEIKFDNDMCISASQYENAVRKKRIAANVPEWETIDLSTIATPEEKEACYAWMKSQLGKKYDYFGILGFLSWFLISENPKRWFCSEICHAALVENVRSYRNVWGLIPPHTVSPRKLVDMVKGLG